MWITDLGQNDEAGQILIERAESVVDPCADAGIATEAVAAVHLVHGRRVVDAVHGAAAEEANVIGDLGEVRPVFGHVGAALSMFGELERALHVVALAALHGGYLLSVAHELLEVHLREHGLGVEGVDVRGPALHHEEDDVFGLHIREVALRRCEGIFLGLLGEQGAKGDTAEAGAEAVEEAAARWGV